MFTIGGLSGVVLANASLDIAFHDKNFLLDNYFLSLNIKRIIDYKTYNDEYFKIFWVGLMDGEGSIQVNHSHKKYLQYRLIIKLNNSELNKKMLVRIAKVIGGNVRVVNDKKDVIWLIDKKEIINNILNIFFKYPPLTSRLNCQLQFLKVCLEDKSVNNYFKERNSKYDLQSYIIKQLNNNFIIPPYFPY